MRELLAELNRAIEQGVDCVLCSVVETRGSTPQKAGAAMLVFGDGRQVGTLGGGCVEAEVKRKALSTLAEKADSRPEVHTFNLDDNYGWDDGLICGGRMSILADPISPGTNHQQAGYYREFASRVGAGLGCTEAVVMAATPGNVRIGSRYLFDETGTLVAQHAEIAPPDVAKHGLVPLSRRPRPTQQQGVAYLPVLPRITLLIVGGGHVGQAVARLGADLDFDVWVLDDRAYFASRERFPLAQDLFVGDIGQTLRELGPRLTSSVYALIVTRGHQHDEEALYHLAGSRAGYVGMIGSKRKIRLIYEDLIARGVSKDALAKVHAPLGFDIGSQTVPEIAVSIVAELIACRNRGATIEAARERVNV